MSFFQKVGIVIKFWDSDRAPAITALIRIVLLLVGVGIGYGLWTLFSD